MNMKKILAVAVVVGSSLALGLATMVVPHAIVILVLLLAASAQNPLVLLLAVIALSFLFAGSIGLLGA